MNRIICMILSLTFLLTGCHSGESNDIAFYYCRNPEQYQYFKEDGVIQAEHRELLGHRNDLQYMIGLYLAGPMDENLISPFTKSTRLLSVQKEDEMIVIKLTDHSNSLSDSEFTLACASLTMTCMHFIPCEEVTVISGERSVTMNTESILLYDTLPQQETTGG